MADIFQEVEEDVRRERAMALYKRYGPAVLGLAVALVVGVAAWKGWESYELSQREKASRRLDTALLEGQSDKAKLIPALEGVAGDATAPYDGLARLRLAQAKADAGDKAGAAAMFGMAGASFSQPEMRDLGLLLAVIQRFDTAPPDELRRSLEELAGPDRPLRLSARELLAALALRSNEPDRARDILKSLVADPASPQALRQRASDMLSSLPGDKK